MIYDILIINWITLEKEIFISKRDNRFRAIMERSSDS